VVAQAHGRLHLVDVLPPGARRTERVPLDVGGIDRDLDRVVDGRRYEHRRKRGLTLVVGVERRQAHHAVHAVLALEVAVGVFPLELQRAGFHPDFVAGLEVQHLDLIAVGLAPAGVHAHEHRRPVERLRAARPGVDVENGPEFVLVAAQHVAHFEFFDLFERRGVVGVHLLLADHALLHEVGHQLKVLGILANGVVILDPCLDPRHLAQLLARLVGVVPEVRLLSFLLFVAQVDALLVDVQTAFQRFPALFDLLDLFRKYHNMLKISCSVSVRRTPG